MKSCVSRMASLPGKVVALLLLTWWLAIPSYALTGTEIISRARVLLNDTSTDSTRQRFSDTQLLNFINDGQREANVLTGVLRSSTSIVLVASTAEYFLPSDYITTWRVTLDGRKLVQSSLNELDANIPGFATSTGRPQRYYVYFTTTTKIVFSPTPTSTSTGTVVVYYIQQPIEFTSASQTPWNSWNLLTPYHSALAYYVAYRGYATMMEATTAAGYLTEWTLYINTMKQSALNMPDYNPGMSGQR